jgi:hypothetical protein
MSDTLVGVNSSGKRLSPGAGFIPFPGTIASIGWNEVADSKKRLNYLPRTDASLYSATTI